MSGLNRETISVALPTLGRTDEVKNTINSLLRGTLIPDEIIVSDQNNPPLLELDQYLSDLPTFVKHVRTEAKGVVFNMNSLLRASRGNIILFLDDDIIPDANLVMAHLANYSDSTVNAVAGRVEQPSGDLPPEKVRKVGAFNRWTGKMTFRFNGMQRQLCVFAPGGNMSFRRQHLLNIGGFDEGFIGNGYFFESDASLRFVDKYPNSMVFDPRASLKHLAAARGGARVSDRAQHNAYFVQNGLRLFRRHTPKSVLPVLALKLLAVTIAKGIYRTNFRTIRLGIRAFYKGLCRESINLTEIS